MVKTTVVVTAALVALVIKCILFFIFGYLVCGTVNRISRFIRG